VIEAGVGGRLDATNVVDAAVVLLTNVGLEHTDLLGETREAIAAEKLAVAGPDATVVLPDGEFAPLVPGRRIVLGGAREAAAASLGRPVEAEVEVRLPGRLELRPGGDVWDGAHTPDAVDWLLPRLPRRGDYALVVSVLDTKDVTGILERLGRAGSVLVATQSSHERALPAEELARRARGLFARVETAADPERAVALARTFGRPLLVTGSLYLLAHLMSGENAYDVAAR
jgi:dihydrofolate synthase/folylpolyglutamate synthase